MSQRGKKMLEGHFNFVATKLFFILTIQKEKVP